MTTKNKELMAQAKEALTGNWGIAIGAYLICLLIMTFIQFIFVLGTIASLIIGGPIALGMAIFTLNIARNQNLEISQIFNGFNRFVVALEAFLIMLVFVILWSLLLIVPGIIAALSYSMTFFILVDNENMKATEAIDQSKIMMQGKKWKLFCLFLRFTGWMLLCILTLGIGLIFLVPYMQVSLAKFYEDIKSPVVV
jgi:uncharacterized membrane protein